MKTVGDALRWASSFLLSAYGETGPSSAVPEAVVDEWAHVARSDAEQLYCALTGLTRSAFILSLRDPVRGDQWDVFRAWTRRRAAGEPLQYITGMAAFYGREFQVRKGCLIPRPETEVLVDLALAHLGQRPQGAHILDLGTGSGILAITLALACPACRVQGVDISAAALAIAKDNARLHGAAVEWLHGDGIGILRAIADEGVTEKIDLLVSNPPYIPAQEVSQLASEVRDWEPETALNGGVDGLDYYRRISAVGSGVFAQGHGALFLEVGAGQAEIVKAMFTEHHGDRWRDFDFQIASDLRRIGRVVYGKRRTVAGESAGA